MAPSTFASAAAGNNSNPSRGDGGVEWPRRANGATQTFRRPSGAPGLSNTSQQRDNTGNTPSNTGPLSSGTGVYVPPHVNAQRNGSIVDSRYSKDQLLQCYRSQKDTEHLDDGLASLFVGGWEPHLTNGASTSSWGRRDDQNKDTQAGADVCWEREGNVIPLGLMELTEEERDTFLSSVNSPLKPPTQNQNKEGTAKDGLSVRKSSISQAQTPGTFGLSSPTSARPTGRRRDTSDAFPFPSVAQSPGNPRFSRDEGSAATPPPALLRRRTDYKDPNASGTDERDKEKPRDTPEATNPFGTLRRSITGPFRFSPMGAFGSFAIAPSTGQASTPTEKKLGFGSLRGESRFKGLMSKESSEDMSSRGPREKHSLSNLGKVPETEGERRVPSWMEARFNRPTSNDTDPFPDEEGRSGSAALLRNDDGPSRTQGPGFGTPSRKESRDEGLAAFGMTQENTVFKDVFHGRDDYQHQTPQHRSGAGGHEPMSPTDTNPYQSPEHDKNDHEDHDAESSDIQHTPLPGLGGGFMGELGSHPGQAPFGGLGNFGRGPAPYEIAASDRSQTSSAGPPKAFLGLTGFGGLPGLGGPAAWPPAQGTVGTPARDKQNFGGAFGEGIFNSGTEVQSPSLAGLGAGGGMFGGSMSGSGTLGRTSRMGSLFPAAMQEQMRSNEQGRQHADDGSVEGGDHHLGSLGRNTFGSNAPGSGVPGRDTDSPLRAGRGIFDDMLPTPGAGQRGIRNLDTGSLLPRGNQALAQSQPQPASSASNQPPAAQQRTMVMPDRMRWIYRDPQGQTQGPWSGLEMHDWYKAGFFSPELLVKKYEDPEYEPLAQLIRRIGNSREPFLVPQIGIPHGPPTTQAGNAWAGATTAGSAAQPPFASSFPSFGTTLTAEQQNALERRKQEEQYLMARQKEHLAQQQVLAKQLQLQGGHIHGQQLHHHSSAHSLHSQPSFGSITSPGGYQPSPSQGPISMNQPVPGFFDNSFRPQPGAPFGPIGGGNLDLLSPLREEELSGMMGQMNLGRGAPPTFPAPGELSGPQQRNEQFSHAQQVNQMLGDRNRLQREQTEHDALQQNIQNEQQSAQASRDRLQQFHELRTQIDAEYSEPSTTSPPGQRIGPPSQQLQSSKQQEARQQPAAITQITEVTFQSETATQPTQVEVLSLTEQVQKATAAKQAPAPASPWGKVDTTIVHPFPPPQSQSPLPAPAAQRKHNVADTLNAESRSRSETPNAETPGPSIAPWAKEPVEAPKGPSLKEIQEMEARKAAQQEEIAAAARRAAFEKEMLAQAAQVAPAPGLPSSANWASGSSPVTASASTPSAWAKPLAGKAAQTSASAKKTLQQIQKEEEARKQKAAAAAIAANAAGVATPTLASGKRYADLASKASGSAASTSGGAWTTVGASGKVKTPTVAIPTGPATNRAVSGGVSPAAAAKARPTPVIRSTTYGTAQVNAQDEFKKWAAGELKPDLSKGINVDEFLSSLLILPPEADIITEAVHSVSQTIDSRHFAEEFIRRRKLADKGIVDTNASSSGGQSAEGKGGWSEVAKKNPPAVQKEEVGSSFKVVAAKKRGGKR
ncbi:hypothetical protein M501DRAFT_937891 [Patellaria atrata CBS 101060]|uniref:GYF domain-containing protein n=1 Tax=Patellaria atrata CBS 101060 TaxID=1346257 RepID=A0A9P4S6Y8_9PEZI|nr:hypothetical protein M501DRAFT_937891 [Patellaria atrata CBS 101060]